VVEPLLPDLLRRVRAFCPDLIGMTTNSRQLVGVLGRAFAEALPDVTVVLGGQTCFPDLHGREHLATGLYDAVTYGEGEETLLEIAWRLQAGRTLTGTAGALTLADGEEVDGGPRPVIADLDSLPFPDFTDLDLDHYTEKVTAPFTPSDWLTALWTRGCVSRCDFCLQRVIWACKFRVRSAANVVAEMDHGHALHGRRRFHFNDLAFNNHFGELMAFCDILIDRGSPYEWGGNASVDRRIDAAYAAKIRDAGCSFVTIGIESASNTVLRAMRKRYTAEQMASALGHFNDAGLRVFTNLVVGHPAEGPAEFDETIEFIRGHSDLFQEPPSTSLCLIQRGTPLHERRDKIGVYVNGGDSAGWYATDGTSDLEERRRRAAILDQLYQELYGHGICMTDKHDPRCSPTRT